MIYAFICTRSKELTETAKSLSNYLSPMGVSVKFLVNQPTMFEGYRRAFEKNEVKDDDIVILCHDDIEILSSPWVFKQCLLETLKQETGFIGVAGTKTLSPDAIWWNQDMWRAGQHSGLVWHGKDPISAETTYYGPYSQVVVMDGLFLAASGKTLREVGLEQPEYLTGGWDYYDLHYTITAHKKGLKNKTVPINILHNSKGELVGRNSWHMNRQMFINRHKLPITVS